MFVRVGSFDFAPNECALRSLTRNAQFTPRLQQYLTTERHDYEGELIPPNGLSQDASFDWLLGRMNEIESAFRILGITGGDVGLIDDRGIPTANYMGLTNTQFGARIASIRVVKPVSYGFRDQAEGLTGRSFSFSVEADYYDEAITGGPGQTYSYTETISWEGDAGPEFVGIPLDTGGPVIQQVREQTIQTIMQQGNAVGLFAYPSAPPAVYPLLKRGAKPVISRQSPIYRGSGQPLLYPISWRYVMLSTTNQFGG